MRKPILVALVALGTACTHTTAGTVRTGAPNNPFVSVEAGNIETPVGRFLAWYLIDRATQTCWLFAHSTVPLDCCAARRVPAVAEYVTWEDAASCAATHP